MDIKDSYLHSAIGVVKSIDVGDGKLSYTLADVGNTRRTFDLSKAASIPFIVGTLAPSEPNSKWSTGKWTGNAPTIASKTDLYDGLTIRYWLPYNGSGEATLKLIFNDGSNTGDLECYYKGTTRLTTHVTAGTPVTLTYRKNPVINGEIYAKEGWWMDGDYDSDSGLYRSYSAKAFKTGASDIPAYNLIGVNKDGLLVSALTTPFLIDGPLYIRTSSLTKNKENSWASLWERSNSITIKNGSTNLSLTTYKPLYLKGEINNGLFTAIEYTQVLPTTEDGKAYLYIGEAVSSTSISFSFVHPIYIYKGGTIQTYSGYSTLSRRATLADTVSCTVGSSNAYRPIVVTNESSSLFYNSKITANYETGDLKATTFTGKLAYTNLTGSTTTANQAIVSNGTANGWTLKTLGSNAFNSTAYLPLSGGTLTGALTIQCTADAKLILDNIDTETNFLYIDFRQNNTSYGTLGITTVGGTNLQWSGKTLLHTGNYSTTLDGRYYTESEIDTKLGNYVTIDTTLTITGSKRFNNTVNINTNTNSTPLKISRLGSDAECLSIGLDDATTHFHYKNDELGANFKFTGEWTNTGDNGTGDNPGSNFVLFYFSKDTTRIQLNDGTNTHTVLHSGIAYIKDGQITINGVSITPLTSHLSLANYVTLDGALTITGLKTFKNIIYGNLYNNSGNKAGAYLILNKSGNYLGIGASSTNVANIAIGESNLDGTWIKELLTITPSGNVSASKFITSGGTSSQFVKGDGSLDSTTYATSAALGNYVTLGTDLTITGLKTFEKPINLNYTYNNKANIIFKNNRIGTNGYADNIIRILDSDLVEVGYLGMHGNSNGVSYYYLGHNTYDGLNLRVYKDSVRWGGDIILHAGNYTNYLGYIGTTAVQSTSKALALTGITKLTFNDSSNSYIGTANGYISINSHDNEICISGAKEDILYINYRKGLNGKAPETWCWKAGSYTSWANFELGNLTSSGLTATKTLKITSTEAESHIAFSRGSHNYITTPSGGNIHIVPNGGSVSSTAGFIFGGSSLYPGVTNTRSLGTSDLRWTNVYSIAGNYTGDITAAKFITSGGTSSLLLRADGGIATFNWSGLSGLPSWVWGGNSQHNYYVYNPANFSVQYATSSGAAKIASELTYNFNFGGGLNAGKYFYVGSFKAKSSWEGYHSVWVFTGAETSWGGILDISLRAGSSATALGNANIEWLSLTDPIFNDSIYLTYNDTTEEKTTTNADGETVTTVIDVRNYNIYIKIPASYKSTYVTTIFETSELTYSKTLVDSYSGTLYKTSYGSTAGSLDNLTVSKPNEAYWLEKLSWYNRLNNTSGYAGDNTGFPTSNNANGILWLSTSGTYGHLLGFSGNGRIYQRYISNGSFPTTANGGSWFKIAYTTDNFPSNQINALTGYAKATSAANLAITDSLNTALGKLEYKAHFAYNWVTSVTATDTDNVINKWDEIVDFINNITTNTDLTDEFVTRKTAQTITGAKTFTASTNTFGGGDSATYLTVDRNSTNPAYVCFKKNGTLVGYIGVSNDKVPVFNDGNGPKTILHSGNYTSYKHAYTNLTGSGTTANQAIVSTGTKDGWTLKTLGSRAFDSTAYLPIAGGTMGGNITMPKKSIVVTSDSTSNYVQAIQFYKGKTGVTEGYDANIGWHNMGDTDGAFTLVPYATTTDPWNSGVGLYISKIRLKYNNNEVLHSGNYSDYTVKKDGTGATGTWGINITGNAATATKLATARKFTIGNTEKSFNGTQDLSWSSTEIGYRHEWRALVKCATWSRLCYVVYGHTTTGSSYIINIKGTRNSVVYNYTYLVTTHHGEFKSNIVQIGGSNYSNISVRACVNTSGTSYFELYDTAKDATSATTQYVNCTLIPISCGRIDKYIDTFTDGTTLTEGFVAGALFDSKAYSNSIQASNFVGNLIGNVTGNVTGLATSATKVYVNNHTTNNTEYPLVWSNAANTETKLENQLYKSYNKLTYNPSTNTITATTFKGNATSASKWATARTITLGGLLQGSVSMDGSKNVDLSVYNYYSNVGIGGTNEYPYHRIISLETPIAASHSDTYGLFRITLGYNDGYLGILRVSIRTNSGSSKSVLLLEWVYRKGFALNSIQAGFNDVLGNTYVDIFYKSPGAWAGIVVELISNVKERGGIGRRFTLLSSKENADYIDSKYYVNTSKTTSFSGISSGATSADGNTTLRTYTTVLQSTDANIIVGSANKVNSTLTFAAGSFAAKTFNGSAAVTVNVPTKTSHLTNDSGYLTSRGYIGTTAVLASSTAQALTGITNLNMSGAISINNTTGDTNLGTIITGKTYRIGFLIGSDNNNRGIYDYTNNKWALNLDGSGNVKFTGTTYFGDGTTYYFGSTGNVNCYLLISNSTATFKNNTILNNSSNPYLTFKDTAASLEMGQIHYVTSYDFTNKKYTNGRFLFRLFSYTDNTATKLNYYENYALPNVDAGLTANKSYTILTTKNPGYIGTTAVLASSAALDLTGIKTITSSVATSTHLKANQGVAVIKTTSVGYTMLASMPISTGCFTHGSWSDSGAYVLAYTKNETIEAGTNTTTHSVYLLTSDGYTKLKNVSPLGNSTYSLGTSSYKWKNVYATTFNGDLTGNVTGNLTGNATSATKINIQNIGTLDMDTMRGDDYRGTVWYGAVGNSAVNNPVGDTLAFGMLIWRNASGYTALLIMDSSAKLHVRLHTGSAWSALKTFAFITDITKSQVGLSNVQNTAFYKRIAAVNGTNWEMAGTNNSAAFTIFAPTTAGTAGQVLVSSGSGAPTWGSPSGLTAGSLTPIQLFSGSVSVSSSGWTDIGTGTSTVKFDSRDTGTYAIQITSGTNFVASGIFSVYKNLSNVSDEIPLHVCTSKSTRLYLRTMENKLQIASNDTSATSWSITIKIAKIL